MSEILISEIVSSNPQGDSIFDKLMNAVDVRLDEQYRKQRISGADYASVYLGAMQTVLQQSIAFALGREAADKQADLLVEQALLIEEQALKATADTAEVTSATIRNDLLADSTIAKNTADIALSGKRADLIGEQELNVQAQVTKSGAETSLLNQKKLTEEAQILDTVNEDDVAGLVGKQKELYSNQTLGFIRDAEQKGAKAFTDLWSIAKSTDTDLPLPYNADRVALDVILDKVAEGMGVILPDPEAEA